MFFASSQKSALSSTVTLLALAQTALAGCSSYITTGPTANQTYNNYAFYDFRNLGDQLSGTPVYAQDENFDNQQFALSTSTYFNSSSWTEPWSTMTYLQKANRSLSQYVDTVFTPLNVAITKDNSTTPDGETLLSLTTTRLQGYSPSAQIQTNQKYMHASVRMYARMLGPPGACGSFYLYGDDSNESDIELLTNDTQNGGSLFHATNHPSQDSKGNSIPGASTIAPIPANGTANGTQPAPWSEWTNWRMDWLSDRTQWIVNGDLVVDKTWSPPKIPSYLSVNMWSNGGSWTGNMTIGSTATLQVRWIEIVYNTTSDSPSSGPACVVGDNNDAHNTDAINANWASPRLTSSKLSWAAIIGVSMWIFL